MVIERVLKLLQDDVGSEDPDSIEMDKQNYSNLIAELSSFQCYAPYKDQLKDLFNGKIFGIPIKVTKSVTNKIKLNKLLMNKVESVSSEQSQSTQSN